MLTRYAVLVLTVAAAALTAGCAPPGGDDTTSPGAQPQAITDNPLDQRLLRIAEEYQQYERPAEGQQPHVTNVICAAPVFVQPAMQWDVPSRKLDSPPTGSVVKGQAGTGHGTKVFRLFARSGDPERQVTFNGQAHPVGTVIVKEAWRPEDITGKIDLPPPGAVELRAAKDGRTYRAVEKYGLFIMLKQDPTTPGTDAGWVYGVVGPDRKIQTPAGAVPACIKCHEGAPHDRLFGPPAD